MEYLTGVVERITFMNEENGYSVIKIKSKGFYDLVTVVGSLACVNVGSTIKLKGEWRNDSKYGKQFSVSEYTEIMPATIAGIEKYLGSGLIKGIGPVNARRIVKHFKEDTINIIDKTPDKLIEIEGIGKKRVDMIKEAWEEQREVKNIMLFLQSNGVSTTYAVKIFKVYGEKSIENVKENPYRLADEIWGIGFKTADRIAGHMGFDEKSYERCRSGIIYALNELAGDGHCFVEREQLIKETEKLLEIEAEFINSSINKMIFEKSIISETENILYLPPFYFAEIGVAGRIKDIVNMKSMYNIGDLEGIEVIVAKVENRCAIKYDSLQREAIKKALSSKFLVLTGGPGTGKTTTTLAMIRSYIEIGARILLAAPTGRAAKRLSEATGLEAKTIHRLLEFKPPEGYKKNAENQLDCDVLIIDEVSMVDIILMNNLLKAVSDNTIIILVGDVDQLPSVGAGNVLKDIINSRVVEVVKLQRIFRQAQGSAIITNAHLINKGLFPKLKSSKDGDFFYIEQDEPLKVVETIKDLCLNRLPNYYKLNPIEDIQVLCPMQRGDTGAYNLNTVLQNTLNPEARLIRYGGVEYRVNDKVMQIKNNYDKNVYNGDIGRVYKVNVEDKTLVLNFDGKEIEYDASELDEVVLAYATTVHKSQGSEYKVVVAPITTQHFMMLQRNLLYTCVTRAKKIMVLVGTKKAIAIAVSNDKIQQRNTMLAERLGEIVLKR